MNSVDALPLWAVLIILTISMIGFIELGYWLGHRPSARKNKAQQSQVRAIMGASLGLVAFMLAFAFSMAQSHFEQRVQSYFLEISAIDSAHRGADLLSGNGPGIAKDILLQFAELRLETSAAVKSGDMQDVVKMIRESEQMHDQLWALAQESISSATQVTDASLFAQSVLAMINAHDARLQTALFNRISPVIWLTLFIMALLSMMIMGYQAGLCDSRSRLATWTLAFTFTTVMALVTDLDRPNTSLFSVNQDLMVELFNRMKGDSGLLDGTTYRE